MGWQYDELILLKLIIAIKESYPQYMVGEIIAAQDFIPVKRCYYYLSKWCWGKRQWFNYGTSPRGGWLQPENIPQEVYKAIELI
jgi:hypothetical protein